MTQSIYGSRPLLHTYSCVYFVFHIVTFARMTIFITRVAIRRTAGITLNVREMRS
ncbi:hypothetical protein R69776_01136 [Paraburkholderia nemoris]|uniref:Uncharacterized protein n=1 Tax=Paraburkholderia nemoris TaxID=2793076 RepID=A0ABM8QS26_9BURK|nr:hypothetical protein R69776_01136 [Paraburkholderia nemoris]